MSLTVNAIAVPIVRFQARRTDADSLFCIKSLHLFMIAARACDTKTTPIAYLVAIATPGFS